MRAASEADVLAYVRAARAEEQAFEIVGGGTRRGVGRPMGDLPVLDVSGLAGIVDYQPEELMVTLRPGTPLDQIKAVLAENNQCLGFDPVHWTFLSPSALRIAPGAKRPDMLARKARPGDATGTFPAGAPHAGEADFAKPRAATIGGAISSDASGPGRLRHGAARDSLLAFRAVNGLAQAFKGGGKVVKNVTGFDLPKLMCGAFGTLAVLTELTFRVYPKPRAVASLVLCDVAPEAGFAALRKIWQSVLEPTGLTYIPGSVDFPGLSDIGQGAALVRFEAAARPLAEKLAAARLLLGEAREIADGEAVFAALGRGALFRDRTLDVWRLALPPVEAARVAAALDAPLWYGDWAGGVLWLGAEGSEAERIRALAGEVDGHAMLLCAPAGRRAALGLHPPHPPALAALTARVKAAFDPLGLFNPGRL